MSQFDISNFLKQIDTMEGKLTPVGVKHGLNPQQKSVNQMPALFKSKKISPVLGAKKDPTHPAAGMYVGDDVQMDVAQTPLEEAMRNVEEDMISKVKKDLTHYLDMLADKVKDEKEIQKKAVQDVEDRNPAKPDKQDTHEEKIEEFLPALGAVAARALVGAEAGALTRGVAGLVGHEIGQDIEDRLTGDDEIDEDPTTQEIGTDPQVKPIVNPTMPESASSSSGAPVVMIEVDEGVMCEIHGDVHRGFEVRRGERVLPTRFRDLDQARTAVELWRARRSKGSSQGNQDYVDEK